MRRSVILLAATTAAFASAALVMCSLPRRGGVVGVSGEVEEDAVAAVAAESAPAAAPVGGSYRRIPHEAGVWTLSGSVLRRGRPVVGRRVVIIGGPPGGGEDVARETHTDSRGEYRFEVLDGWYELSVSTLPRRGRRVRREFDVTELAALHTAARARVQVDGRSVRRDLTVPAGRADVTVVDATTGAGIAGAVVWTSFVVGEATTDERGRVAFDELPTRELELDAEAAMYLSTGPSRVALSEADPIAVIRLEMLPAGALEVSFRGQNGETYWPPPELRSSLRSLESGAVVEFPRARGRTLTYEKLLPGRYRLVIGDETGEVDREPFVRFQPIDPVEPRAVEVEAGRTLEVEIPVRCRARIELAARTRDHLVAFRSSVRVVPIDGPHAGRIALPLDPERDDRRSAGRYRGYLPPGDYAIEVRERGGRVWHDRMSVEREPKRPVIALPW